MTELELNMYLPPGKVCIRVLALTIDCLIVSIAWYYSVLVWGHPGSLDSFSNIRRSRGQSCLRKPGIAEAPNN